VHYVSADESQTKWGTCLSRKFTNCMSMYRA